MLKLKYITVAFIRLTGKVISRSIDFKQSNKCQIFYTYKLAYFWPYEI